MKLPLVSSQQFIPMLKRAAAGFIPHATMRSLRGR